MKGVEYRATMTEAQFQAQVIALAERFKWLWFHLPDTEMAKRAKAGFPDLVLARKGKVIFAELKREGKRPTPEQAAWLTALGASGRVYTWWPSDLPRIERILR